jgi:single-stranded DNA-binding protein
MTEAVVSFAGNLTDDPELRHTKSRIAAKVRDAGCMLAVRAVQQGNNRGRRESRRLSALALCALVRPLQQAADGRP